MKFRFDSLKTTQAAAHLLTLEAKVMDRMRLLKLLYIADRELLASKGRTLTGDRAVAMNFGPVLSHTYNLIKGTEESPADWNRCILSVGKKVVLLAEPGLGELSNREIDKLEEVSNRFRAISTAGLSAYTHEFSEWARNFEPDTSRPIPWADALVDQGAKDKISAIEERLAEQEAIDSIFALPGDDGVEAGAGS
ncbi:Panacea domain-containing protein [Aquisphaera insulae]|uniref:Panacea domain-containing protein n=1 Tax=Aquisphaera insulae TaxID=2712864 RepID=UPI0013ED2BDA|nr:Panacea domain-containing protein [Aquisphaera insulae]